LSSEIVGLECEPNFDGINSLQIQIDQSKKSRRVTVLVQLLLELHLSDSRFVGLMHLQKTKTKSIQKQIKTFAFTSFLA
jgi:hypothetical protein